jgi:hypothetical protein
VGNVHQRNLDFVHVAMVVVRPTATLGQSIAIQHRP